MSNVRRYCLPCAEMSSKTLETMPDNQLETVYAFVQFLNSAPNERLQEPASVKSEAVQSMLGIAHEYANPSLIAQEEGAFERAIAENMHLIDTNVIL